jgi:hypothetical protein
MGVIPVKCIDDDCFTCQNEEDQVLLCCVLMMVYILLLLFPHKIYVELHI